MMEFPKALVVTFGIVCVVIILTPWIVGIFGTIFSSSVLEFVFVDYFNWAFSFF